MEKFDSANNLLAQVNKAESATINQSEDPKQIVTTVHATNVNVLERFAAFITEDHKKKFSSI